MPRACLCKMTRLQHQPAAMQETQHLVMPLQKANLAENSDSKHNEELYRATPLGPYLGHYGYEGSLADVA